MARNKKLDIEEKIKKQIKQMHSTPVTHKDSLLRLRSLKRT